MVWLHKTVIEMTTCLFSLQRLLHIMVFPIVVSGPAGVHHSHWSASGQELKLYSVKVGVVGCLRVLSLKKFLFIVMIYKLIYRYCLSLVSINIRILWTYHNTGYWKSNKKVSLETARPLSLQENKKGTASVSSLLLYLHDKF